MAANKIKGITIEIGGDTTGLDKALRGVNSEIKTTQNELKDVEKALKLDPANVELLEQKQRLLADAVEQTAKKLDTLKTAQEQAQAQLERGEISQQQYDALTREVVKAEKALKDAQTAAAGFDAELAKARATLEKVGTTAGNVANATKGLSTAAAGVAGGIIGMGLAATNTADELNTLSQKSGIATDELQRIQYAAGVVDVSAETIAGALSKMRKQLATDSGAEKFAALGVSVRGAGGQLRDSTEIFYDTLKALSRISNETERDVIAMDIFGKSADQLAGIVDDGGEALKALGDEAERLGLVMDQQTLDSLNAVNDEIEKLKAQAKMEFFKAGASAMESLTPVIEDIIGAISSLLSWIGQIDPAVLEVVLVIATVIAAIAPIAGLIAHITTAVSGIIAILPALGAAMSALPFVAIAAAIAALAAVIVTNWDEIRGYLEIALNKVKEVFGLIADAVTGAIEKIKSAMQAVKDFFLDVWAAITDYVKIRINTMIGYVNEVIGLIDSLTTAINNSAVGKALDLNIGQIGAIPELTLSGRTYGAGNTTTNNYTTTNYNTSSQPMQVNLQMDGRTLATQMVQPMRIANGMAGGSNMR